MQDFFGVAQLKTIDSILKCRESRVLLPECTKSTT